MREIVAKELLQFASLENGYRDADDFNEDTTGVDLAALYNRMGMLNYNTDNILMTQTAVASLSCNGCVLAFFASIFVPHLFSQKLVGRFPQMVTVRSFTENQPWMIGKM